MNDWLQILFQSDVGARPGGSEEAVFLLLLSLTYGQIIGWIYILTHRSLSYSQSFTASLVIMPVLVSFLMMLMVGSVVVTFGLLAVFAVVRFRNVLKDTRDTTFVLWSIIQGMAVGTGRPGLAAVGLIVICFVTLYLRYSHFGAIQNYDVILNLLFDTRKIRLNEIPSILNRHCLKLTVSSSQPGDEHLYNVSYRLLLRDPDLNKDLQNELEATQGIQNVSLFQRKDESEV